MGKMNYCIFCLLILLDILHQSTEVTTIHHDKPKESSISIMALSMSDTQKLNNITLSSSERQKRLLPYVNFYQTPSKPDNEIYEKYHHQQQQQPKKIYYPQPQEVLYQPKSKYTPFLESNALPGRFQPMVSNSLPQRVKVQYVQIPQNKVPNFSELYDKLSQLKFSQNYRRPGYIQIKRPLQEQTFILKPQVYNNRQKLIQHGKTTIETYTPTNIDIPSETEETHYQNYPSTNQQILYSTIPHQDTRKPFIIVPANNDNDNHKPYILLQRKKKPIRYEPLKYIQYEEPKYQQAPKYHEEPKLQEIKYEKPKYEEPKYQEIQYEKPKYEGPKYQEIQYEKTKYEGPKYQEIQYEKTKYEGPKYQEIQYEKPKYQEFNYEEPKHQEIKYEKPKYEGPKYQEIQYEKPKYQVIQYEKPKYQEINYEEPIKYEEPQYEPFPPRYEEPQTVKYEDSSKYIEISSTPRPQLHPPQRNSIDLAAFLKHLQSTNTLPKTLTTDNIDNSIKTLVTILNTLKKQSKIPKPIVVPDEDSSEYENEAGVGIGGHPNEAYTTEDTDEGGTPGKPGVDYPALSSIPPTSFNCKTQRYKGFFGDPDTNCQVWHYCDLNGGQASFLCPNGTIFSQVALTCDWWYNVKCSSTAQLYVLNERLYKYIIPLSPKFPEDYTGPLVDKYLALKFQEMEDKMRKEKKGKGNSDEEEESESSESTASIDTEADNTEKVALVETTTKSKIPQKETLDTVEDDNVN